MAARKSLVPQDMGGNAITNLPTTPSGANDAASKSYVDTKGDVVGPASSTANALPFFSGTTGKLLAQSTTNAPTLSSTGVLTVPNWIKTPYIEGKVPGGGVDIQGATGNVGSPTGGQVGIYGGTADYTSGLALGGGVEIAPGSGPGGEGSIDLYGLVIIRDELDMNGKQINNLPTTPIASTDAASKAYADTKEPALPSGGTTAQYLRGDKTWQTLPTGGSGDVVGPASATDNAIARFDATTGKLVQNSGVTISDTNGVITDNFFQAATFFPSTNGGGFLGSSSFGFGGIYTEAIESNTGTIEVWDVLDMNSNVLKANTINESTADAGVTIDGVLLKDSKMGISYIGATGTPSASTYLRGDGTWATVSGSGDVVGPASAVSGNIATYSGTTGKLIADGGKALPTGAIVGLTDTQALTNKDLTGAGNTFPTFNQNTTGTSAGITGKTTPTGAIVGTTDTQTLTNKDTTDATNTVPFRRVIHGATASTARPNATHVEWIGSVAPTNGTTADTWIDTA